MRRRALHFLLLGSALFLISRAQDALQLPAELGSPPDGVSRPTSSEASPAVGAGGTAGTNDPAELGDEEILFREALARGLLHTDAVVRRRLLQNMRFLREGADGVDDEGLFRQALHLGLHRRDLVVRRRLVERVRLAVAATATATEPSPTELETWQSSHPEPFAAPARVRLSHLFFSQALRGERATLDARRALRHLARRPRKPVEAGDLGDPFLALRHQPLQSERELARIFGPRLAQQAMGLPVESWSDPVASAQGWHLLWIHEVRPGRPWPLAVVRGRVREALLAERGAAAVRLFLTESRARHRSTAGSDPS